MVIKGVYAEKSMNDLLRGSNKQIGCLREHPVLSSVGGTSVLGYKVNMLTLVTKEQEQRILLVAQCNDAVESLLKYTTLLNTLPNDLKAKSVDLIGQGYYSQEQCYCGLFEYFEPINTLHGRFSANIRDSLIGQCLSLEDLQFYDETMKYVSTLESAIIHTIVTNPSNWVIVRGKLHLLLL